MAGALSGRVSERGDRGHARSLFSRQRRRVDLGTRSRSRDSLAGQLFLVARTKGPAPGSGRAAAGRARKNLETRVGMGANQSKSAAGQIQGALAALRRIGIAGIS